MSRFGSSPIWCLCEKLPRSILHIEPTQELWCEVCGRRRRPRDVLSSSSDEDEKAANRRQLMLAEQRRAEETRQVLVRVKVAMSAQKPNSKAMGSCLKCGGKHKLPKSILPCAHVGKPKNHEKLCIGRFRYFRKPQRMQAKHNENDVALEAREQLGIEPIDAPPPSPSSPPIVSESVPKATESLWEQPNENMPNLVAFAHEVFNRPLHLRKCQPTYYDTLFVSDFIPLDKPITDAAGGAISKRRKMFGRPIRPHRSRSLPPLAQVLSEILAKQNVRSRGGGLTTKETDLNGNSTASQFPPFDCYDGPSEDALVVDSARHMLRQPKALHINQREDLPSTRLLSFESEPSSDFSSSSPFEMPSAPPVERQRHSYVGVGVPLRMHDVMKAVAQSGLSDSSASSSSSSSSHKSVSSTQPPHQQSVRSCGGEDFQYVDKLTVIKKIIWLMDQKPESTTTEEAPAQNEPEINEENQEKSPTDSVKGLLQFMENLHIAEGGDTENTTKLHQNSEDELKSSADHTKQEPNLTTDMSNELNLNSVNKSAGDAMYVKVLSNSQQHSRVCHRSCQAKNPPSTPSSQSNTSIWSAISGFFTSKVSGSRPATTSKHTVAPVGCNERQPLRSTENLNYGTIPTPETKAKSYEIKQALRNCKASKCSTHPTNPSKPSCPKCNSRQNKKFLDKSKAQKNRVNSLNQILQQREHKSSCKFYTPKVSGNSSEHSTELSTSSLYQTARTSQTTVENSKNSLHVQLETTTENSKNSVHVQVNLENIFEQENMQLQNILNVFKRVPSPPRVFYPLQIVDIIRHECIVIDKPKAIAYITDLVSGERKIYNATDSVNVKADASFRFIEFRTPDIAEVITKETHIHGLETATAYLESTEQTEEFSIVPKSQPNRKKSKHISTGWPSFSRKHRKPKIQFRAVQMEMTYTIAESEKEKDKENLKKPESEKVNLKERRNKIKNIDSTWIANKSVQKKIDEMMTKPIKLLNLNKELE